MSNIFRFFKSLAFIVSVLAISFSLAYFVSAWTEPSVNPPNNNVSTPLNIGSTGQSKSGGLILNTGGAANGLIVQNGNVGIGTASPGAKLDVAGQVKITGGSPGTGKVLTSDASGLASWQTAAGGGAKNFAKEITPTASGWTISPSPLSEVTDEDEINFATAGVINPGSTAYINIDLGQVVVASLTYRWNADRTGGSWQHNEQLDISENGGTWMTVASYSSAPPSGLASILRAYKFRYIRLSVWGNVDTQTTLYQFSVIVQ